MTTDHSTSNSGLADIPDDATLHSLGNLPPRWGRMPLLCRAVVVAAGRLLQESSLTKSGHNLKDQGLSVGLIGATRRGSLTTDLDFAQTLARGPEMASPALFGYTLANMPLAEAAVHFGLIGPVYSLFSATDPLDMARKEAERWMTMDSSLSFMLACGFDHCKATGAAPTVTFTLVQKNTTP